MTLGTVLVIIAIVLALVALFVPIYAVRLLCAGVITGFIGVLLGVGPLH